MIKVLFYNRSFYGGGAEKVLLDYVRGLDKQKFDITVMVRRDEGAFREQFHGLAQEGIHIRRCCDWIKPGKHLLGKLKNYLLLRLADWSEFRFPGIFYRIALREKFDVEIAFMHDETAAVIASSSNHKSKKLLWVHTDLRRINTWKTYFRTRARQRRLFGRFDRCVCVSQVARQSVEELLGLTERVMVLHNPVDRERIIRMSEEPCALPEAEIPTVCAVGRLNWEKNFAMLIQAHANLIHKGVAHRLCIVGEGPERTTLEGLIKELKVDNTAILAGHQSNPYPYMASASFLAMSSVYEGYPTVVMEALVLGKPVVSSCAAAREVFGEYPCGVVTENNCTALEEGLERMLTDATLRKHCTASATERGADLGMERPVRRVEQMLEQSL